MASKEVQIPAEWHCFTYYAAFDDVFRLQWLKSNHANIRWALGILYFMLFVATNFGRPKNWKGNFYEVVDYI